MTGWRDGGEFDVGGNLTKIRSGDWVPGCCCSESASRPASPLTGTNGTGGQVPSSPTGDLGRDSGALESASRSLIDNGRGINICG